MARRMKVDPHGNCKFFDRVLWSLIEEPDDCELCSYFDEDSSECTCEAQVAQMAQS